MKYKAFYHVVDDVQYYVYYIVDKCINILYVTYVLHNVTYGWMTTYSFKCNHNNDNT